MLELWKYGERLSNILTEVSTRDSNISCQWDIVRMRSFNQAKGKGWNLHNLTSFGLERVWISSNKEKSIGLDRGIGSVWKQGFRSQPPSPPKFLVQYLIGREDFGTIDRGFSLVASLHWTWDLAIATASPRGLPQMLQLFD